ncbi:MAG: tyrosine-type recombinase/integrase [Nocardioidaceae bacterium]
MRPNRRLTAPDLAVLLPSWELSLRAERKSPQTIKAYGDGVRRFLAYCDRQTIEPVFDRATATGFVADLLDSGAEAATARARQLGVRRFSAWLTAEGEYDVDPLLGLVSPKLDRKVLEPLREDALRALLKTCTVTKSGMHATPPGDVFRNRRDEAILRFMIETGARAGEVVAIELDDLNTIEGRVVIRRGKGAKGRVVPFGSQTAVAIDRYLRQARTGHRLASTPALWLGDRGKSFVYDGLHATLKARAAAAGVSGFHPHRLRHTAAHRWLAAGGSEGGLMAVAGWERPDMLLRYTRAQASARAADEASRLNLGDL